MTKDAPKGFVNGNERLDRMLSSRPVARAENGELIVAVYVRVATTVEDLADLPVGTRIATNTNKVMELDEIEQGKYWIEKGTLEPYYSVPSSWLPAFVLPPVVTHD